MVEISKYGSGEGLGTGTSRAYSTFGLPAVAKAMAGQAPDLWSS